MPESDARSVISTQTFGRALTASVDSCAEINSAPTNSGQVWRKVPESDARSVGRVVTLHQRIFGYTKCFKTKASSAPVPVLPAVQ